MCRLTLFLVGIAWFATLGPADEKKVPLQTDLPQEILAGTPPNVLVLLYPGLELPSEKVPEFLVPEGTKNLALKKKVTSSESEPILGALEFVTDGNKEGSEDSYVELSPGVQWVQIDLEKPAQIYAMYIWHYFREARGYHDVIVQVADDAEFSKNIQTVYNNDTDASAKMGIGKDRPYIETYAGRFIDAKGITGRYVRLYSRGNTANSMNHYVEVEVFAKPAS
ncbi:MAG: discoidin domain-containing protein [Pirellulaceae bacterium]